MRNKTNMIGLIGLVLAFAGLFVWAIRQQLDPWSLTPLALGVLLVLAYILSNFNEIVAKISGRSAREGVNSAVMILITLLIISFLQVILTRHSARIDTTRSGKYSLSEQTVQVLRNLDRDVNITFLWNPEFPGQRQQAEDLFEEFAHHSDKVNYEFIDPIKDNVAVERFSVGGSVSLNSAYVESGTKREKVTGTEEGDFTNAIIKVTREQDKVVYFLSQHGEKEWDNTTERNGVGFMKEALEEEAYTPKELVLAELTEMPDDAALLIIPGPLTELFENEIAAIREYLKYGGNLFLMQDPRSTSGLEPLIRDSYGVNLHNDVVLDNDPLTALFGQTQLSTRVRAASYGNHETTEGIRRIATVYDMARSVEKAADAPADANVTELVKTSDDSFGETDVQTLFDKQEAENDPSVDHQGPLALAVAVEWDAEERVSEATEEVEVQTEQEPKGRMVVVGDSDFASNVLFRTNRDFLLNCVNWTCQESDLISIRPKQDQGQPIFMTGLQQRLIFWVPVIIIPLLVAVIGFMVYLTRRVRG